MHDNVAVVEGDPLPVLVTLDAQWLYPRRQGHPSLHFVDQGAHLAVVTTRREDEGVETGHQGPNVEGDGVLTEFFDDPVEDGGDQAGDVGALGPLLLVAAIVTQWATPRTSRASRKGMLRALTAMTTARERGRRCVTGTKRVTVARATGEEPVCSKLRNAIVTILLAGTGPEGNYCGRDKFRHIGPRVQ